MIDEREDSRREHRQQRDSPGGATPTVSFDWLHLATRDVALLMIPIAHHPSTGSCAMISLREPQELFGAVRDAHREAAAQSAELATNISQGLDTVYAATVKCFGQPDVVVMVPWATPPACVLTSTTQRAEAAANGQQSAWCTLDALDGHIACFPVGAAFLRIAALTTVGAHGSQNAGTWASSRPMVRARTAHSLASTEPPLLAPERLEQLRADFFELEAARGTEIRALLVAADPGTGELIALADKVMTAADYRMELPFPVNGLPDFSSDSLRSLPFVERPLQLSTSWLVRLPPQQVPPGFKPRRWTEILRPWARRACCAALNQTADRDFECLTAGASARRRPGYLCIGPGGGSMIPHADGIGSYNALSIVWELDAQTGLYDALDFARPGRTHWVLNMLRQLLGDHDDQQLMSLVMDGVRWGVQAPMQIRIAANLERLDERVRGVGDAFAKLLKKGLYYKFKKLRRVNEMIDPDGPGPFITIPVYVVGTGGTDKPDNPHEKRIVGDQGCPHPEQALRERNQPHGTPDGPLIVSLNDMMGPTPGSTPRGHPIDPTRYPMPDTESKPRPRHSYRNGAILSHMAHVNKTYKAGFKDDGRHMFFQFEMAPEEERTCSFATVIPFPLMDETGKPILDENGNVIVEHWFTLIVATCMNMGSRNSSKIAQRFTDRILEGFSQLLDVYVRDTWLPKQTPELRALLAERAATLGPRQARPFDTSGYTDDYKLEFVGPELLAAGARIWRTACRECNYWLSEKACAGTVLDYIGGRLVLNGGFGCISPSKRARAIADSEAAIGGRLTREQLESHNSFLVHVHEWLDFPMGTLKGLSAPLKLPGSPEQRATLSDRVRAQHRRIIELLQTRHAASFWSGVDEAARLGGAEDGAGFEAIIFAPRITSDACSDVDHPYICGVCNGLFFRFPLDGAWQRRHITITETCGTVLALTIFARYFPHDELLVESDATASLASAQALAMTENLIYIRRRAEEIGAFREATRRAWLLHCQGWANARSDAGSRDKMTVMYALAAAMGIRLREVPIPAEALAFMQDVLDNTSEADHGLAAHDTSLGTHNLSMSGDMPIAHLPMLELLIVLDEMLRIGEHEKANCLGTTEAIEWAIAVQARAVAECAGATLDRRPPNSAHLIVVAIQAACRCLRRPHMFPSISFAAGYTERMCETRCTESMCRTWMIEIERQTRAEATSATRETRHGCATGWATAAASRKAALALGLPAGHNPTQWWQSQRESRAADARRAERAAATAQARIDALRRQATRSQRDQRAARREARQSMRAERDEARAEYDRARAEFEAARAQLPAIEEEFRSLQERLSNAHSEVRARLAEHDTVPRERPGHRSDRDPSGSGQLSELARSTAPPLPEGAVAWCACPACPLPVYPDEGRFCDLCWPVGCGCGCACQCQCEPVERAPRRRRLEDAEHRQSRIDLHLSEQVIQVLKEWLGLRRDEWRARLERLPHFDLNDSDASDDESTAGGQHSTSRGAHNLAMVGDMPIAQVTMIELLHTLDAALHGGESPAEIEYRTIRIAVQAGYKRTERSTLPAIQAACRHLCRPPQFPSAESAAAASCSKEQMTRIRHSIRQCTFWVTRIRQCIADETGDTTTAVSRGQHAPTVEVRT